MWIPLPTRKQKCASAKGKCARYSKTLFLLFFLFLSVRVFIYSLLLEKKYNYWLITCTLVTLNRKLPVLSKITLKAESLEYSALENLCLMSKWSVGRLECKAIIGR